VVERSVAGDAGVTIVGAGGIGCALGHALRTGGIEVTFVDVDEPKLEWGRRHGVVVDDLPPQSARFAHFQDWRPSPDDTVLLCTKCYDNASVLSRLPAGSEVIPVQNGFDRALIARSRIEGIASFVSECDDGRSHTRITRAGQLHIGDGGGGVHREVPDHIARLIETLERHGQFGVRRVPDVLPFKYAKLMYNAAISPLAAMAGLDNGQLLTYRKARRPFFTLLRENFAILQAARIPLGRIGPFHPTTVDRILRWPFVAKTLAWPFSRTLRRTYCSMSGDIPTGRTEIDNFNGHLIELAGGRACELNRAVHALVTRMANERLVPGLHWLDEIAA